MRPVLLRRPGVEQLPAFACGAARHAFEEVVNAEVESFLSSHARSAGGSSALALSRIICCVQAVLQATREYGRAESRDRPETSGPRTRGVAAG